MAKYLDPRISGLSFDNKDHPGCLWGVLRVLRAYPWSNVKKMMPNKKFGTRKKTATMRYSRLRANDPNTRDAQGLLDADADDMNMREIASSSTSNISRKSQDNMASLPTFRSYFLRTDSIHHLDPSSHMLPDEVRDIDDCSSCECKGNPYLLETSDLPASFCDNSEMCSPTSSAKSKSHTLQTSNSNRELIMSESFPMDDERRDMCQTSKSSSSVPQTGLKKRSFKDIKQKIKDVIKESRKDRHRISMDAIFDKVPYGSKLSNYIKREMANDLESTMCTNEEAAHESSYESTNLEPTIKKHGHKNVRRTQSLNESLDRYSQLLELSAVRENKHLRSRSLKLTDESGASSFLSTPKVFGRLLSLPNPERHRRTESEEGIALESSTRVLVNNDTTTENSSFDENAVVSVSEENHDPVDGSAENKKEENLPSYVRNVQVEKRDEADFNYVKDILKQSGLIGQGSRGTWYSPEQPLDPSLFEKLEKMDYSENETSNCCDHQLLFDMINEVLQETSDKYTYWPLALSSNCNVRPMPLGVYVLEEVWEIIRFYLNRQPEFEWLDHTVVRDLSKNNGWMNLQFDSEYVGLELEEMILDDLLDEMIYE